jgi:hypothetical protein
MQIDSAVEFGGAGIILHSRIPYTLPNQSDGRLGEAHSEIRQWCAEHGHRLSSICWEIYGHWEESWKVDPSKIRTDVFHLLEDEKGWTEGFP